MIFRLGALVAAGAAGLGLGLSAATAETAATTSNSPIKSMFRFKCIENFEFIVILVVWVMA